MNERVRIHRIIRAHSNIVSNMMLSLQRKVNSKPSNVSVSVLIHMNSWVSIGRILSLIFIDIFGTIIIIKSIYWDLNQRFIIGYHLGPTKMEKNQRIFNSYIFSRLTLTEHYSLMRYWVSNFEPFSSNSIWSIMKQKWVSRGRFSKIFQFEKKTKFKYTAPLRNSFYHNECITEINESFAFQFIPRHILKFEKVEEMAEILR